MEMARRRNDCLSRIRAGSAILLFLLSLNPIPLLTLHLALNPLQNFMAKIRVMLPQHLQTLAHVAREVHLDVPGPVTQRSILDALEARYPTLRGTIRDHATQQRRPMLRYFACEEDLSLEPPDAPLPDAIASGAEPFWIVGAIAGG